MSRGSIKLEVAAVTDPRAMALRTVGGEITEGEWAGTTWATTTGGTPWLSVKHSSGFHTETWLEPLAMLQAWLEAIRPTMEDVT